MTARFQDGFDRSNNATVDAVFWSENDVGTWSVNANLLRGTDATGVGKTCVTTPFAHAPLIDCEVSFTRIANSATFDAGPLCATNSTGTSGYYLDIIGTGTGVTADVWRIDGPATNNDTQVGTTVTGLTVNNGDRIKIRRQVIGGNVVLTGYINDRQVIQVTDSSASKILTAGQCGIVQWATSTNDYDNFLVDDLTSNAPRPNLFLLRALPFTRTLRSMIKAANAPTSNPDVTVAISGVSAATAAGNVTPSTTVPVTGNAATAAVGTAAPATAPALTGNAATSAVGTLAPSTTVGLTGNAATGQIGSPGAAGDVTTSLTGVQATGQVGTVTPGITVGATGVQGSGQVGNVGPGNAPALTGVVATSAVGAVAPSTTVGVTGVQAAAAVGDVTPQVSGDVTVALTGVQASGQVGNVNASGGDSQAGDGGDWLLRKRRRLR